MFTQKSIAFQMRFPFVSCSAFRTNIHTIVIDRRCLCKSLCSWHPIFKLIYLLAFTHTLFIINLMFWMKRRKETEKEDEDWCEQTIMIPHFAKSALSTLYFASLDGSPRWESHTANQIHCEFAGNSSSALRQNFHNLQFRLRNTKNEMQEA